MIRWNWLYIDRPADRFDEAFAFWTTVSGTRLTPRQGDHAEFATLRPGVGDPYLAAQAVGDDGGAHPDLDVDDLAAARDRARACGATLLADHDTWSLVRSPGGQRFCLTTGRGQRIPAPVSGPDGAVSRVDQICLDIPPAAFDAELRFWTALTGWPLRPTSGSEFRRLLVPPRLPVRMLLQRLGPDSTAGAHIDIACSDIEAVAAWHESLGARRIGPGAQWLVMADPAGGVYCLTDRDPFTGKVTRRSRR